jgi:nucleotide-binding universal stress UspA family protein
MPLTGDSTILVPVDVSITEPPDQVIPDLLKPVNLVVLGYYPVPKQTAPAHLKKDHEAEAAERLESIVSSFVRDDHEDEDEVEDVLVFTKDRQDTIDRIAEQHDCDAIFVPGATGAIDRILVPLRGDVNLERIVSLAGELVRASDATVTLFHSVPEGTDPSQGEFILRGAADRLAEDGVDRNRIDWQLSEGGSAKREIIDLVADYDFVVLGEAEPSLRDRILGAVLAPILEEIEKPAIIVRDIE